LLFCPTNTTQDKLLDPETAEYRYKYGYEITPDAREYQVCLGFCLGPLWVLVLTALLSAFPLELH
jgi:hypothetical protein